MLPAYFLPHNHLIARWQLESTKQHALANQRRLEEELQASRSSGGEACNTAANLKLALGAAQDESKKLQQKLEESGKSLLDCRKEAAALHLQLQQLQQQLSRMQSQHAIELADRAAAAERAAADASAEARATAATLQALQDELTRVGSRLDEAESSRYRTESKLRALEEEKSRAGASAIAAQGECARDVVLQKRALV
jgi:chromosome segregation ATPase